MDPALQQATATLPSLTWAQVERQLHLRLSSRSIRELATEYLGALQAKAASLAPEEVAGELLCLASVMLQLQGEDSAACSPSPSSLPASPSSAAASSPSLSAACSCSRDSPTPPVEPTRPLGGLH